MKILEFEASVILREIFFFFFLGDEDAPESLSYVPPGRISFPVL